MLRHERLGAVYREHHAARRARDFVFCEPERAALSREWVGRGKRVLDLGCRTGALTRAYLDGSEVTGVDVDGAALADAAGPSSPASCGSSPGGSFASAPPCSPRRSASGR